MSPSSTLDRERGLMKTLVSVITSVRAYGLVIYSKAVPFRKYALPIITLIIGIFIGDGGVLWQQKNYNLEIKKLAYEIAREQNTVLREIMETIGPNWEVDKELRSILDRQEAAKQLEPSEVKQKLILELTMSEIALRVKMKMEKERRDALKQRYRALEMELARLEGREPQMSYLVDSKPSPTPTNFKMVTK
jgi:hypothetical protein